MHIVCNLFFHVHIVAHYIPNIYIKRDIWHVWSNLIKESTQNKSTQNTNGNRICYKNVSDFFPSNSPIKWKDEMFVT